MNPAGRLSWKDVRDEMREAILVGRYGPGDRLPKDADIAEAMHCARSTVQRAMQDLSDSGLVERRRKGGTRVRPHPVTRATLDIAITRHEVEQKGARHTHQLINVTRCLAPRPVLAAFEMAEATDAARVEALHLADGRPYIFEDRWISLATVPEFVEVDLNHQSANEWLVLNRPYSRCDVRFYATSADDQIADLLQTEKGTALLVIERTTWIDENPITTVKAITKPGYQLLTSG